MSSGPPESASRTSFGSRPSARASEIASATPSTAASSHVLTTSLNRCPRRPPHPAGHLPDGAEDRLADFPGLDRSGREDDELALLRRLLGAEHGRVDEHEVVLGREVRQPLRGRDADSARLDPGRSRLGGWRDLVHDLLDGRTVGEQRDHDVSSGRSLGRRARDGDTVVRKRLCLLPRPIPRMDVIPRARKIPRDRKADRAGSEYCDRRLPAHVIPVPEPSQPKRKDVCEQPACGIWTSQPTTRERKGSWQN